MSLPYRSLVLAVAVLASVAASPARQAIGTLTAELGGDERTWTVVAGDDAAAAGITSHWTRFMSEVDGLVVGAVAVGAAPPESAIRIEMANTGAFPDRCPCTFRGVDVVLWTGPDPAGPRYASSEAEVVITVAEERSGETFRIEGTVAGTLLHRADGVAEPDADEALELRGSFAIPRLPLFD